MFTIPNPKKTITIDFSIEQVMSSIPKINIASDAKYKVTEVNPIFNQVILECLEFLSLGVYIDFNLVKKSDTSTEITIEIRRKIGSFDTDVEIQKANYHFKDLVNHLSEIIVLSNADFNKKYATNIANIDKAKQEEDKPWFAKKNVATLLIILGYITLPLVIGIFILPLGIYARIQNKKYLNSWKTLLLVIGLSLSYTASAQWVSKKVDNGFDAPYKIAHTDVVKNQWLKLENYNNEIFFYIGGVYICDETVNVDISFLVNGVYQKYNIENCAVSEDKKTVFLVDNLTTHELFSSFKTASLVKIRINDNTCGVETYEFKMSGSTAAYNYVIAP